MWFNCICPCFQLVSCVLGPFLNLLQECYKRHFELKNRVQFNCFILIIRLEIGGFTKILGGRLRVGQKLGQRPSSSPNMVAAGPEPGGHQALLPCGRSQVTGVPIAASLWLPSPGELLSLGLYPHTPLASGSCTQHTLTHVGFWGRVCSVACSGWGHVGGPLCCTLQFPTPVLITP